MFNVSVNYKLFIVDLIKKPTNTYKSDKVYVIDEFHVFKLAKENGYYRSNTNGSAHKQREIELVSFRHDFS